MIGGNLEGMHCAIFFNVAVAGVGKFINLPCVCTTVFIRNSLVIYIGAATVSVCSSSQINSNKEI